MKIRINLQSLRSIFKKKYSYEQKYSIKKKSLGSGGNAIVKRAKQKWDNQEIALKILTDSSKRDQEKKARFEDEIKIMSANAPIIDGIIPILDYSIKEWRSSSFRHFVHKNIAPRVNKQPEKNLHTSLHFG